MKNLLVIPLVLLSFCVIANDRVMLGSFEQETAERAEAGFKGESTLSGYGARVFNFIDEGLYLGAGFAQLTGEIDICLLSDCETVGDATKTMFSGEIGRDFGQWIPFVGASFSSTETEETLFGDGFTESEGTFSLTAGLWLELDTLKLRGALTDLDDNDSVDVSGGLLFEGGLLFPMDNDFALGAEFGMLLDSEVDGFTFSVQFGRKF